MQTQKVLRKLLHTGLIVLFGFASAGVSAQETIVYFTRHGEDTVALRETGNSGLALLPECQPYLNDGAIDLCCLEVLSPLGERRAELLAQWFAENNILDSLTHVFSTYKSRTLQTVRPTALAAGLDAGTADVDKNPGDGVQQIPPFVDECQDGFESPSSTLHLVVEQVLQLPAGSQALVCGHSSTVYPMMELLGIDTSDNTDFPRNPESGRVQGFNNLWAVKLDASGAALLEHYLLDFALSTSTP